MEITVNGEARKIADNANVQQLLHSLEIVGARLAVELNNEIVPRSKFSETALNEGDRIEIVQAIGGG